MSSRVIPMPVVAWAAAVVVLAACGQRPGAHAVAQTSPQPAASASAVASTPTTPPPGNTAGVAPRDAADTAPASPSPDPHVAASQPQPDDAPEPPQVAPSPSPPDPGAPLWGRTFASVRVTEGGREKPLVPHTRLRVNPFLRDGEGQIRYSGDCNTGGASLIVTTTRFEVGDDGASSAAGCREDEQRQGDWFRWFLTSDPHWALSPDRRFLELTSGDTVIRFEEHPWLPWSREQS